MGETTPYAMSIMTAVAKEFGFEEEEIVSALQRHNFSSSGDLVEYLMISFEKTLTDPLQKIREETSSLLRQEKCSRCKEKKRDTVFQPCGHFVMCHSCSIKVVNCPCGEKVMDSIQTTMGMKLTDVRELAESRVPVADHQQVLKETNRLYRERMCRGCNKEERNVVLLPCSHLALCRQCAPKAKKCKCGEKIEDSIIIYMA